MDLGPIISKFPQYIYIYVIYVNMCINVFVEMCVNMCVKIWVRMCVNMSVNIWVNMFVVMPVNILGNICENKEFKQFSKHAC